MKTTGSKDYLDMAEAEEDLFGFLDYCHQMESLLKKIEGEKKLFLFLEKGDKRCH